MSLNYLSVNKLRKISNYKFKLSKKKIDFGNVLKKLKKNTLTKILIHDQKTFLQSYLDRLDRIGMMYGIEVRPPYLDRRLINYANNLNASEKMTKFDNVKWSKISFKKYCFKIFLKKKKKNLRSKKKKVAFSYPIEDFLKSTKSKSF